MIYDYTLGLAFSHYNITDMYSKLYSMFGVITIQHYHKYMQINDLPNNHVDVQ